jgi:serine/threonine protein kinase
MLTLRSEHGDFVIHQKLQDALFGGVYRATRFNGDFAVKVLEKSRLNSSANSCEKADAEIRYGPIFRGHPNLLSPLFFFEDSRAHYVVMPFARGSDMLEMLKRRPEGLDEPTSRCIFRQAISAVAYLHENNVALQDISLENFLLFVNPVSGLFEVRICDPGQAVTFQTRGGVELLVQPQGLVGKAFRPPEIYADQPYLATKVDSWCLGWSLFYCLTARQLFQSSLETDEDFRVFQRGSVDEILERKDAALSETAANLIFALVRENPASRISIRDVLDESAWFKEPDTPWSAPMKLIFDERKASPYAPPEVGSSAAVSSVDVESFSGTPAESPKVTTRITPRVSPRVSARVSPRIAAKAAELETSTKLSGVVARFSVPRIANTPAFFAPLPVGLTATHLSIPGPQPAVTQAVPNAVSIFPSSNNSFTNSIHASIAFQRALDAFQPPPIVNWRR